MKRKFFAILATLAMVLATFGFAQSASAEVCTPFSKSDHVRLEASYWTSTGRWVDVTVKVNAYDCVNAKGEHKIDPANYVVSYNAQGSSEGCGWWDQFENVKVNLYIKDGVGRNYHPQEVILPCEKDTTNTVTKSLSAAPRFTKCFEVPSWKANIEVTIARNQNLHDVVGGSLWYFIGPVPNDCD